MSGTLFLIGTGPGDPELLTLKALRLIQSGAIIAYPVGADSGESLARRIAAPHILAGTKEYGFSVPMRVERGPAETAYEEASAEIAQTLAAGDNVVLLCEGDPLFYGSAMYLLERLEGRFACEIVPGITSLTACAAVAHWPLAARNDCLKVLPAPLDETVLRQELDGVAAAAIIKVGRHFQKVWTVLDSLNLVSKAVIVERATLAGEKIRPLSALAMAEKPYFSTILVYAGKERWGLKDDG